MTEGQYDLLDRAKKRTTDNDNPEMEGGGGGGSGREDDRWMKRVGME